MAKIEKALYYLNLADRLSQGGGWVHGIDPRAKWVLTIAFLIAMLSVPLMQLSVLILFFLYPILMCLLAGIGYGKLFIRSLIILPFVLLIGIFNPMIDRQVVFSMEGVRITAGWISFCSIVIRGLLSVQTVFILVYTTGFYSICLGMQRLRIPQLFTNQVLFVYRYLFVLLQEALSMQQARDSRSFGRRSYPLRMWGIFVGQLLLRTVDRAKRIHNAMLARGYVGRIEGISQLTWRKRDTLFLLVGVLFVVLLRFEWLFYELLNSAAFLFVNSTSV